MFREQYCVGVFDQCARYQVALSLGMQHVPEYMLPNQNEWACQVIQEMKEEGEKHTISQPS
jgi:hypothetical protein